MKNQILKITTIFLIVGSLLTNCNLFQKDDKDDTATTLGLLTLLTQQPIICNGGELEGDITVNTIISGTCTLKGPVFVKNGATLTVEAGSFVYGQAGSALFILPDSKIIAEGTATNPIVFTSNKPVGERKPSDWGGIVIIGKAPISQEPQTRKTEGTDPQPFGQFNIPDDNSGILKYVRIEFAGNAVATGNELNGLSLYSVGSGTKIEHIQIHMGSDDAIEIFGGRVEPKYLLLTGTSDDDVDIDAGYFGTIKYVLAYRYPASAGNKLPDGAYAFELDGAYTNQQRDASYYDKGRSVITIENFTMIGIPGVDTIEMGESRDCAKTTLNNGSTVDLKTSSLKVETTGNGKDCDRPASSYTSNNTVLTNVRRNTRVTTDWNSGSPDTPPVFVDSNIEAFPNGNNWTKDWTIWRNN